MYEYLIATATINGPQRLENFIQSVIKHTKNIDYKISIADDNSELENSKLNEQIAKKYNCLYSRNEDRQGVPYTWNRAAQASDSKYIVIANDDMIVTPLWLSAHKHFYEANLNKKIGVIGYSITNSATDIVPYDQLTVGPSNEHILHPVISPAGCLFIMERKLYNLAGGFDERYFAGFEEVDFCATLNLYGYKNLGMDSPLVYHQNSASFSDPINQKHPAFQRTRYSGKLFIDKWCEILNLSKEDKDPNITVQNISKRLISIQPFYSYNEFTKVNIFLKD